MTRPLNPDCAFGNHPHRAHTLLSPGGNKPGAQCGGVPVYGMCTACGSIEVELVNGANGTRDFSSIGESATYPTGYGCECCS